MTIPNDTLLLLNAYQDGELSPSEAIDMARRLESEPDLHAMAEKLSRLSGRVGETVAATPMSPLLRARVVEGLGFADSAPRRRWAQPLQSLAATILLAVLSGGLLGSGATFLALGGSGGLTEQQSVLAGHLRALEAPQPFDIASSDRHVVKPWFNGKTVVAPQAIDLADKGFPLIGGRIDIVGGKPVPTLVYRGGAHLISVTVVPSDGTARATGTVRDGYALDGWTAGDLTYWAVSDIDRPALTTFEALFRAELAKG